MEELWQMATANDNRARSLQVLEEIAYWKLMQHFQDMIEEVERYKLAKAGFNPKK